MLDDEATDILSSRRAQVAARILRGNRVGSLTVSITSNQGVELASEDLLDHVWVQGGVVGSGEARAQVAAEGVVAHPERPRRTVPDAVAAITKVGGAAFYDWQFEGSQFRLKKGSNIISDEVPRWPKWLVDRLGVDSFGAVTNVSFRRSPMRSSPMRSRKPWPRSAI